MKVMSKASPSAWAQKKMEGLYAEKLNELKGVPLKISQILSMSSDSKIAETYLSAVEKLQPLAPEIMLNHLAKINPELFQSIEFFSEKCFSASMGQVHAVVLKDGRELALKILYPFSIEAFVTDEKFINQIFEVFSHFKKGFALENYKEFILNALKVELNLRMELAQQTIIYNVFRNHEKIIIPNPIAELSNEQTLLMSYEPSDSFFVCSKLLSHDQKVELSCLWVEYFFKMIFEAGKIHADPNAGNYGVRLKNDKVQLVVYDFGSVVDISKEKRLMLLKLFADVLKNRCDIFSVLVALGFDAEVLRPIEDRLLAFIDLLIEPFISDGRYDLRNWNRKERAKNILGDLRWNFMLAAPAELLPLMRMLHGFFHYLNEWGVGVYAKKQVDHYLMVYQMEIAQFSIKRFTVVEQLMSTSLVIQVNENGEQKVKVTLPRKAIERLDEFIDDELQKKLNAQKISVDEIVNRARSNGYRPAVLFEVNEVRRKIKVSLEV